MMSLVQGLVTLKTGVLIAFLCVPLLCGIYFGNRFFARSKEDTFRRKVLILLLLLSVAALVRTVHG
jgi:uncharacterized membrane protein YfcA